MFGNLIKSQVLTAINQRFEKIGTATDFSFSGGNLSITLLLKGETEPIVLEARDIAWDCSDGKMNIYFSELSATKIWIQEIFNLLAEKTGRVLQIPDSIKLMPIKALLPKKR